MFTFVFVFLFSFVFVFLPVFTIVFVFVFALTSLISHNNYSSCRSGTFRVFHLKANQVLCEHLQNYKDIDNGGGIDEYG